jgi:hypothetical protein
MPTSSTGRSTLKRQQPPKKEHQADWRRDRIKSRSDWTIHVLRPSGARDIYYVHTKVVDDLSRRRVAYFEPIFKDNMKQIGDRTSEISLPSDIADVFDKLLDFLYCEDRKDEEEYLFNVKNGLSLYKIAEYFKIVPLQTTLATFYRETTMPFNVMEFIQGAKKFENQEMLDSGMEQFALTMHTLEYVEEEKLEPAFLLEALKKRSEMKLNKSRADSENISCLVALCTKHYKDKLTRSLFYKLTQEAYIPKIDQEAALQLLTVEAQLGYWKDTENFSTVQARCIQSLLSDWKGLRLKFGSDSAFWKTLRGLSPNVLGILLMQSTGTAQGQERHDTSSARTESVVSPTVQGRHDTSSTRTESVVSPSESASRDPPALHAFVNYR